MTHHVPQPPEIGPGDENYLDPELEDALDDFFDGWKAKVRSRLVMGEKTYQGKWLDMSETEVVKELMDEVLDMIGYAVFLRYKTETPAPGPDETVYYH